MLTCVHACPYVGLCLCNSNTHAHTQHMHTHNACYAWVHCTLVKKVDKYFVAQYLWILVCTLLIIPCIYTWKNSAWLGTSIMIDKETPLAKIVGQMLLSRNTDVSTQSWVFISVNDPWIVYTDEVHCMSTLYACKESWQIFCCTIFVNISVHSTNHTMYIYLMQFA